jgi:MYXO-CTERM domain-containing protein
VQGQVQAQVQSEVPTEQEEGVVSMTADTAAGSSIPDYTVSLLIALTGLLFLLAPALLRRRPDEETA